MTDDTEDGVDRLRMMLGEQLLQDRTADPALVRQQFACLSSDSDEDEKILSFEHRIGGSLEHCIGSTKGGLSCRLFVGDNR
jgi:hypothetical protein